MDLSKISDEEQLNKLLSECENFEERKKIRGRIKELREEHMKEWEAKQAERAKARDTEDPIKKRHREADLEKQKKLEAFKEQAKEHHESKHLEIAEQHLRDKHRQADEAKKKQLEAFDKMAGKGAVSQTSTVKTDVSKGRAPAKPVNPFKAADAAAAKTKPPGQGRAAMVRSPSAIKTMLLEWTKAMTREYAPKVEITNFSTSWNDGMAFCALIHHFYPEAFDFDSLDPKKRRKNFELAFDTAEKYADIAPLLDVEDMVRMKKPDWKCVFTYVQSFYRKLKDHDQNKAVAASES